MTGRAGTPPGPEGPRGVRIVPIDPGRPGSLGAWFAPIAASGRADWPAEPGWALHERAALLAQPGVMTHLLAIAAEGRETLGSSQVRLPLREDTATADIEVWVAPAHRGRGIGRALLGHAERVAYEHGRRIVSGSTDVPLGSPEAARRAAFARAAGYAPVLDEERHALALPVDPGLLDSLESAARPHAEGYRFAGWAGRCPAPFAAARADAARRMSTDAPHGSLEAGEEEWDVERLRRYEDTVEAMRRDTLSAAAIGPAGELVGFTEIGLPRDAPSVAYQFDTIVLGPHRGHRLGLLLKIANLRAARSRWPRTERVLTWNAASNAPMIRVNALLGFRRVGTGTVWQRHLPDA